MQDRSWARHNHRMCCYYFEHVQVGVARMKRLEEWVKESPGTEIPVLLAVVGHVQGPEPQTFTDRDTGASNTKNKLTMTLRDDGLAMPTIVFWGERATNVGAMQLVGKLVRFTDLNVKVNRLNTYFSTNGYRTEVKVVSSTMSANRNEAHRVAQLLAWLKKQKDMVTPTRVMGGSRTGGEYESDGAEIEDDINNDAYVAKAGVLSDLMPHGASAVAVEVRSVKMRVGKGPLPNRPVHVHVSVVDKDGNAAELVLSEDVPGLKRLRKEVGDEPSAKRISRSTDKKRHWVVTGLVGTEKWGLLRPQATAQTRILQRTGSLGLPTVQDMTVAEAVRMLSGGMASGEINVKAKMTSVSFLHLDGKQPLKPETAHKLAMQDPGGGWKYGEALLRMGDDADDGPSLGVMARDAELRALLCNVPAERLKAEWRQAMSHSASPATGKEACSNSSTSDAFFYGAWVVRLIESLSHPSTGLWTCRARVSGSLRPTQLDSPPLLSALSQLGAEGARGGYVLDLVRIGLGSEEPSDGPRT